MKKKISLLLSSLLMLMMLAVPDFPVFAASLTIGLSGSNLDIGDTVTATISVPDGGSSMVSVSYDASVLSFVSSTVTSNGGDGGKLLSIYNSSGAGGSVSGSITFKAVGAGTTSITATSTDGVDINGDPVSFDAAGVSVSVNNAATQPPAETPSNNDDGSDSGSDGGTSSDTKSGNNSLSRLSISEGTLSPAFQSSVKTYSATVRYEVTNLSVSAVPSDDAASVESVTGNSGLEVGANVVRIVVRAENGVTTTYTINVKRLAEGEAEEPQDTENPDNTETPSASFQYGNVTLVPAAEIPEDVIPQDFVIDSINIDGANCKCLSFQNGNITLLYLLQDNMEETGDLFVYNRETNAIYPFVKFQSENGYVVLLVPSADLIPEGYMESQIDVEGKGTITVYEKAFAETGMNSSDFKQNIFARLFTLETVYGAELSEQNFCYFYGVNNKGEVNWYQYDKIEGTYQRYLEQSSVSETELSELQKKYDDKANELKNLQKKNRYLLFGMILGAVIFLIIIINIILFKRKDNDIAELEEDIDEETDELENLPIQEEESVEESTQMERLQEEIAEETVEENTEGIVSEEITLKELDSEEVVEEPEVIQLHEDSDEDLEAAIIRESLRFDEEQTDEPESEEVESEEADDDEVEVEFYEMEEAPEESETEESETEETETEETEEDDEVEVEFYEMEETPEESETEESEIEETETEETEEEDDEVEVEFYEMEEAPEESESEDPELEEVDDELEIEFYEMEAEPESRNDLMSNEDVSEQKENSDSDKETTKKKQKKGFFFKKKNKNIESGNADEDNKDDEDEDLEFLDLK